MPKSTRENLNRIELPESNVFGDRGTKTKWPTMRGARLNDKSIEALREFAIKKGRSIVFIKGEYESGLNRFANKDPKEQAVFFEYLFTHPSTKDGIYLLAWVENYWNGSIFHCGWQFPHVKCWEQYSDSEERRFECWAFDVYKAVARILYEATEAEMDKEVRAFIS